MKTKLTSMITAIPYEENMKDKQYPFLEGIKFFMFKNILDKHNGKDLGFKVSMKYQYIPFTEWELSTYSMKELRIMMKFFEPHLTFKTKQSLILRFINIILKDERFKFWTELQQQMNKEIKREELLNQLF